LTMLTGLIITICLLRTILVGGCDGGCRKSRKSLEEEGDDDDGDVEVEVGNDESGSGSGGSNLNEECNIDVEHGPGPLIVILPPSET